MYTIDTYQDADSLLWGYIVYDDSKPISTSSAVYDTRKEAVREASALLAESDNL